MTKRRVLVLFVLAYVALAVSAFIYAQVLGETTAGMAWAYVGLGMMAAPIAIPLGVLIPAAIAHGIKLAWAWGAPRNQKEGD